MRCPIKTAKDAVKPFHKKLSFKQLRLLRAIEGFNLIGQDPSQYELSKVVGTSQAAVSVMVNLLQRKGALISVDGRKRTMKLLIELD